MLTLTRGSRPATVGRKGLHPGGRRGAIGVRLHRPVPVLALVGAPLLLDNLVLPFEVLDRVRARARVRVRDRVRVGVGVGVRVRVRIRGS